MDYKYCKSISYKLVALSCKDSTIFGAYQNVLAEIIGYYFTEWFRGVLYQFLSTQPNLYRFLSFFSFLSLCHQSYTRISINQIN